MVIITEEVHSEGRAPRRRDGPARGTRQEEGARASRSGRQPRSESPSGRDEPERGRSRQRSTLGTQHDTASGSILRGNGDDANRRQSSDLGARWRNQRRVREQENEPLDSMRVQLHGKRRSHSSQRVADLERKYDRGGTGGELTRFPSLRDVSTRRAKFESRNRDSPDDDDAESRTWQRAIPSPKRRSLSVDRARGPTRYQDENQAHESRGHNQEQHQPQVVAVSNFRDIRHALTPTGRESHQRNSQIGEDRSKHGGFSTHADRRTNRNSDDTMLTSLVDERERNVKRFNSKRGDRRWLANTKTTTTEEVDADDIRNVRRSLKSSQEKEDTDRKSNIAKKTDRDCSNIESRGEKRAQYEREGASVERKLDREASTRSDTRANDGRGNVSMKKRLSVRFQEGPPIEFHVTDDNDTDDDSESPEESPRARKEAKTSVIGRKTQRNTAQNSDTHDTTKHKTEIHLESNNAVKLVQMATPSNQSNTKSSQQERSSSSTDNTKDTDEPGSKQFGNVENKIQVLRGKQDTEGYKFNGSRNYRDKYQHQAPGRREKKWQDTADEQDERSQICSSRSDVLEQTRRKSSQEDRPSRWRGRSTVLDTDRSHLSEETQSSKNEQRQSSRTRNAQREHYSPSHSSHPTSRTRAENPDAVKKSLQHRLRDVDPGMTRNIPKRPSSLLAPANQKPEVTILRRRHSHDITNKKKDGNTSRQRRAFPEQYIEESDDDDLGGLISGSATITTDGRYAIERLKYKPNSNGMHTDRPISKQDSVNKKLVRQRSRSVDHLERTDIDEYIEALSRSDEDVHGVILERAEVYVKSAIELGESQTLADIYKFANVTVLDSEGNTPLHCAAQHDRLRILTWLMKNPKIDVLAKNTSGETCAHVAVRYGHLNCLKCIINNTNEVKPLVIVWERDLNGMSILHLAAELGHSDICRWLVETFGRALCIVPNDRRQSALHVAASKGHLDCVRVLCKELGDHTDARDELGATALYYATEAGYVQCVHHLAEKARADVTIPTHDGVTPLMTAVNTGRLDIVNYLLKMSGANSIRKQTQTGATVFHMAAGEGHADVLELLLQQPGGTDAVRLVDARGSSPAHEAAKNGHIRCLKLLLRHGLSIHLKDKNGLSPYSLALRSGVEECRKYVTSLTEGRELDLHSVDHSVRSTVAADDSQMDYSSLVVSDGEESDPDHRVTVNNQRVPITKKSPSLLSKFRQIGGKTSPEEPRASNLKGEFILKRNEMREASEKKQQTQDSSTRNTDHHIYSDVDESTTSRTVEDHRNETGAVGRIRVRVPDASTAAERAQDKSIGAVRKSFITVAYPSDTDSESAHRNTSSTTEVLAQESSIDTSSTDTESRTGQLKKASEYRLLRNRNGSQTFETIAEVPSSEASTDDISKTYDVTEGEILARTREFISNEARTDSSATEQTHRSVAKALMTRFHKKVEELESKQLESDEKEEDRQNRLGMLRSRLAKSGGIMGPYYDKIIMEYPESELDDALKERRDSGTSIPVLSLYEQDHGSEFEAGKDDEQAGAHGKKKLKDNTPKFTYLPQGTLTKPTLHHVDRTEMMNKRASFDQGADGNNNEEYASLQAALKRRLSQPARIPNINLGKVKQYEKLPHPPSELEFFFKNRRQIMRNIRRGSLDEEEGEGEGKKKTNDEKRAMEESAQEEKGTGQTADSNRSKS